MSASRALSAPLLPTNLGFDERSIKLDHPTATVLDGLGSEGVVDAVALL